MGWQQRGEKRYYYRSVWQDGRSVCTYLGAGDVAELAAAADALRRVQREIEAWFKTGRFQVTLLGVF